MGNFSVNYYPGTDTLTLSGELRPDDWVSVLGEVDTAFRRTPCHLVIDLRQVQAVPPSTLGLLVKVCNTCYPGTVIRLPDRRSTVAA